MEYERQQREYWRAQEQQRQEQQRQQQIWNDNARRQQEEMRRLNTPSGQGSAPSSPSAGGPGGPPSSGTQSDALEEARRTWQKRPALAADRNPLLGKWTRPASTQGRSSDPFAQLGALMKGGLCEMLFGGGVFEFRQDRMMGSDQQTGVQELDRVECRGDAKRVAVIPRTTLKLIVFDFDGPNRINWAGQDCVLLRVGAAPAVAAAPATAAVAAAPAAPAASGAAPKEGGVINLAAGFSSTEGAFAPLAGSKFIVLRNSVDVALARAGYRPPPGMSIYKGWLNACQTNAPGCAQGLRGRSVRRAGRIDDRSARQRSHAAARGRHLLPVRQRKARCAVDDVEPTYRCEAGRQCGAAGSAQRSGIELIRRRGSARGRRRRFC